MTDVSPEYAEAMKAFPVRLSNVIILSQRPLCSPLPARHRCKTQDLQTTRNAALRGFYLRRNPRPKRTPSCAAHTQKLRWLLATKAALQQPFTLVSINFSEVQIHQPKMPHDFSVQFRNLGLIGIWRCPTLLGRRCHVSYASNAKATASFASDGIPNSSEKCKLIASG